MNAQGIRNEIGNALREMVDGDLAAGASEAFSALGYRSKRTLSGQSGDVGAFVKQFPAANPDAQSEREFRDSAKEIRVLFQFTGDEVQAGSQGGLFDAGGFEAGNAKSFLFAAVQLCGDSYTRSKYVAFTRELNKRLPMPVVVLFRTAANRITLAFVHRRPNKRDPDRDVLGSVSLIREIEAAKPHRAHLDILAELSLPARLRWMNGNGKPSNFDGLLDAWLDALDTKELNKRFYRDLYGWFDRARDIAQFTAEQTKALSKKEHVIRLITRLMFVWFIKEKGLVADELFIEKQAEQLLKDYDGERGDSYYRAVLQNLFFATLNTEIDKRDFSKGNRDTHRDFSLYRYRDEIAYPDRLLKLFSRTPFINGGLFDCLDDFEGVRACGVRVDCFTDNPSQRAGYSIPNRLFFDDGASPGLITLFKRYKFTVEENTPTEQEVALDPELLGKVFENLLAAVNPETRGVARKEQGSYYTPRVVVDYMADEALEDALARKLSEGDGDADRWRARLGYLLDYGDAFADAETLFTDTEREGIVRAIAGIKVLDPAVGSGAFPMGVLHKLTLALRRLDGDNQIWEGLQKERARERAQRAFDTHDPEAREGELGDISRTFEKYRDSDFGRKLYLIQNSIYGVDSDPIAAQIAKLRFFISLAIEQQTNDSQTDNYGIRPLPNLETRFVAADTLLKLERPSQMPLGQTGEVQELEKELASNREQHFHASKREEKLKYRRKDAELRERLGKALGAVGFPAASADQLAAWDPFDQNAKPACWFDAEYMFGVSEGFDVVIGNPPYVQLQRDGGRLGKRYGKVGYETFAGTGDIYQLFYERGCQLLSAQGVLAFITSNSWLKAEYGKGSRRHLSERHTPFMLLEMGKDVFDTVTVDASILLLRCGRSGNEDALAIRAVDVERAGDGAFPPPEEEWGLIRPNGDAPWSVLSKVEQGIMDKMLAVGTPLKEWDIAIYRGITTGLNDAFIVDNLTKEALVAEDPRSAEILKPVVRGRDIRRYRAHWAGLWLIAIHNGYGDTPAINVERYPAVKAHLDRYYEQLARRYDKGRTPYNLRNCAYHADFAKEKLLWIELVSSGRFAYDNDGFYGEATTFLLVGKSIKYLCAMLNAKLIRWFLEKAAPTSGMGTLRWKKVYVEPLPIPKIPESRQQSFIEIIDRILLMQQGDPEADISQAEGEIDKLVCHLYGLTPVEISAVEGTSSPR